MPDAEFAQVESPVSNVSLQELRAIILALKMASFPYLDPTVLEEVQFLIKKLPGAEELEHIAKKEALTDIRKEVANIMTIVDRFAKQGPEYKARYMTKTKLPPRYKVLEWREKTASFNLKRYLTGK